jgi:hypothetical protein
MFPRDDTLYEASTTINVGGDVKNIQCYGEIGMLNSEGLTRIELTSNTGIQILHHTAVLEAVHDSVDSFPQPRCHPDTRTKMLQTLWNWSTNSESLVDSDSESEVLTEKSTPILWVYGPAGAGKSAIMQTLSRRLKDAGRLGGSFFFKRGHATRGNAKALFATLAYQIALNIPQFKVHISQIVEDDPSVVGRSLDVQMQKLILEPCQSLDNSRVSIIIIDGLDNCEDQNIQREILGIIGNAIREHSPPLRIIIASRPEPHIREFLAASLFHGLYRSFNVEQSFKDVETYLRGEFARIHDEHHETMSTIPNPWPSEKVIHHLVYKSSGYFIYATTIIKFIDDKNFRPTERLAAVESLGDSEFESPFGTLDELYTQILSAAPAHSRLLAILRVIASFQLRPRHIEQLLQLKSGDVRLTLRGLHSVLSIPLDGDRITVHHASFLDFLDDPICSGQFYYIGGLQHRMDLARAVLRVLSYTHDDPCMNRAGHVGLSVFITIDPQMNFSMFIYSSVCDDGLSYIPTLPPSSSGDLIPLVRLINPDFIFYYGNVEVAASMYNWLKVSLKR